MPYYEQSRKDVRYKEIKEFLTLNYKNWEKVTKIVQNEEEKAETRRKTLEERQEEQKQRRIRSKERAKARKGSIKIDGDTKEEDIDQFANENEKINA